MSLNDALFKMAKLEPGRLAHVYNPSLQETEAGGLGVSGQPGPHNKTLSWEGEKVNYLLCELNVI
jgi:hypothetical protein